VLGVLVFLLLKDNKPSVEAEKAEAREKLSLALVLEVIKMPALWILSAILCCTYVMNIAFYYFTPYATSRFGMAATAGAIVTIAAQYVRPVAAFGGGIFADKIGRSKIMYVTFSLMAICTFLMVIMGNMSSTVFIVLCILIYLGMYGGYSLVFSMMEEGGIPIRVAGTAIGLVCTLGYLPEVIVPFCSGKLLDTFGDGGYRYMFIAITIIMVIGIVMLTIWDRYVKKVKNSKEIL
jgi:nitrate/nitrite transporter NarK